MAVGNLTFWGFISVFVRDLLVALGTSPAVAIAAAAAISVAIFLFMALSAIRALRQASRFRASGEPVGKLAGKFSAAGWGVIAGVLAFILAGMLSQSVLSQLRFFS
jgi:hypothetical protein